MELTLQYGLYNSILSQGQRIRRMRRTELSYDKICYLHSPRVSRPTSRDSITRSAQSASRTTSMPKLESLYAARAAHPVSASPKELNLVHNQYYKGDPRHDTVATARVSRGPSPYATVGDLQNNSYASNVQRPSSKSHQRSEQSSFLQPKSKISNNSQSSQQKSLRPSNKSNSKHSQLFPKSQASKHSYTSSKNQPSKVAMMEASTHKYQVGYGEPDTYQIRKNIQIEPSQIQKSSQKSHLSNKNSNSYLNKNSHSQLQRKSFISPSQASKKEASKIKASFLLKKEPSNLSQLALENSKKEVSKIGSSKAGSLLRKQSSANSLMDKQPSGSQIDQIKQQESNLQKKLSSSQYMQKSSMLDSGIQQNQYFKKSKISIKNSKDQQSKIKDSSKLADPILISSGLKEENWKETIKSINVQQQKQSHISNKNASMIKKKKKSIVLSKEHKGERNLSLKIDSVRNEGIFKLDSSKDNLGDSSRHLSVVSKERSSKLVSEFSEEPPCRDCIEDVIERIQLYDTILEEIKEFSLSMGAFDSALQNQQTQILCFLLDKKYMFEKSNLLKAIKGNGRNVFILPSVEIPDNILKNYIDHPLVTKFASDLQKANVSFYKQFAEQAKQVKSLTKNNPLIDPLTPNDKFTDKLVELIWEQIDSTYEHISNLSGTQINDAEDLVIEMMELIFLFSNMRGRWVKRIEFADFIEDFDGYFEKNMPKLESTLEFFRGSSQ